MAALDALLTRERAVTAGALAAAALAAWGYTAWLSAAMYGPEMAMMPPPGGWTAGYFALTLFMWSAMMAAMMLPSAAPMVLTFATIAARRRERGQAHVPTAVFVAGYLAVWSAFSLGATLLQWALQSLGLVDEMMENASPALAGALLLAAGLYQWSALKLACLAKCRSPFEFILTEWRDGVAGALRMGLRHGLFCLGCCWALMLLLFAAAVMHVAWVGALALLVALEKLGPRPELVRKASGAALALAGLALLAYSAARAV
jgi:predicted metal-binding membrane protein